MELYFNEEYETPFNTYTLDVAIDTKEDFEIIEFQLIIKDLKGDRDLNIFDIEHVSKMYKNITDSISYLPASRKDRLNICKVLYSEFLLYMNTAK